MAWLDESPGHANSDLGLYWRMGLDVGLDQYGGGVGIVDEVLTGIAQDLAHLDGSPRPAPG